jgi:holo-[acyl-carrier protein] synthase
VIFGLGTDILDVARMETMVARGEQVLEAIFTPSEMEYCRSKRHSAGHFAARYAAKEAFLKALGTGWQDGLAFSEIEVTNDEFGAPRFSLHGRVRERYDRLGIKGASLSMTHVKELAMAVVLLEK